MMKMMKKRMKMGVRLVVLLLGGLGTLGSGGGLVGGGLLRGAEEADEEVEVGGEEEGAASGREGSSVAVVIAKGELSGVRRVEVEVGRDVAGDDVSDELEDLQPCDAVSPPRSEADGRQEVIEVHDNVHSKVQEDGNPLDRGVADDLGVAEDHGEGVVVDVEEAGLAAAEDEEGGVDELVVLGEVVEVVDEHDGGVGEGLDVADGPDEAVADETGDDVLEEEGEEDERDAAEKEVVEDLDEVEERLVESSELEDELLEDIEHGEVAKGSNDDRVGGGEGGDAFLEAKVPAGDLEVLLEDLVKGILRMALFQHHRQLVEPLEGLVVDLVKCAHSSAVFFFFFFFFKKQKKPRRF